MSLLLEALKKAEKAKEEAQRRARGDAGESAPQAPADGLAAQRPELSLEGDAASGSQQAPEEVRRVVTRAELPEISAAPLEIASEDLAPKGARPEMRPDMRPELRLETPREPGPRPAPGAQGAERA